MKFAVLALCAAAVAEGTLTDTSDIYAQPPSTLKGCECKGKCTTSALFECNVAPFCSVKGKDCRNGTAEWSVTKGYYDYCSYEQYKKYEDLPAAKKKAIVMAHVNKDKVSGKYPAIVNVLTGILGESVMVSFDASADVFPQERKKYIHSVGVTGGIRFDSNGKHPYKGLLEGAEHGILRLSSAKDPTGAGAAPGMGIKFFRDGRTSANFVAMYSLDGQPCSDKDFFQHDWNNHIALTDNFGLKIIAAKFWQASYCPLMVGLSDLATGADGAQGEFPFKLNFHSLVKSDCDCNDYAQCLQNLITNLPVGTKIFEVRAQAAPNAPEELIGSITITDAMTTSKFGDEELFFKHQHMEDDYALKTDWLATIDRKAQCGMGCTGTKAPTIDRGCSSPFNSTMREDDVVVV